MIAAIVIAAWVVIGLALYILLPEEDCEPGLAKNLSEIDRAEVSALWPIVLVMVLFSALGAGLMALRRLAARRRK
jgi:hypothetical protein